MLKRQRPATPPPSSLGDPPFLQDGPIRPFQPLHAANPSHPRLKRQRTRAPPLDGALRGWLGSESSRPHWESDGEEDWIEEPHAASVSPLAPSTAASPYKDANNLLHELHVLNQHRLLFVQPPLDLPPNPNSRVPLPPAAHGHVQDLTMGHGPAPWTNKFPYHSALHHLPRGELANRSCIESADKGLVEEVQHVRQRYEGANRLLGSLFLSRRREVEGSSSSAAPGPSR